MPSSESTAARLEVDLAYWAAESRRRFGTELYALWCQRTAAVAAVRAAGGCECCASINAGRERTAVCRWTANGTTMLLCALCRDAWRELTAEDPSYGAVEVTDLAGDR